MSTTIIQVVLISEFDFYLPDELIAQEPLASRSASRMLFVPKEGGKQDRSFIELPDILNPTDLIVLNNSRVFPARLFGHRAGLHAQPVSPRNPAAAGFLRGRIEVLLTRQTGPWEWHALVKPGRKLETGERLYFGPENDLQAEIIGRGQFGERTLRFQPVPDFYGSIERLGYVPLPPYINRPDRPEDRERYQTVYARKEASGSVAAPTAGLHFTPDIFSQIRERGIEIAEITLHVGLGTFQPVRVEQIEEHKMHCEPFSISSDAAEKINRALTEKRRIVAVGTTTVRTLEYAALQNGQPPGSPPRISAGSGEADIFIYPGFQFRVVDAMLTNFHLPKSTLLILVAAFGGKERVLAAYEHAVKERYRFFSYGDCMFVERPVKPAL